MALFFTFEDNRYNLLVYFLVTTIVLYLGPGFFFRQGPYSYSIEFQLTVLYNKNSSEINKRAMACSKTIKDYCMTSITEVSMSPLPLFTYVRDKFV